MSRPQIVDPKVAVEAFRRCPFFEGYEPSALDTLAQLVEQRTYEAGETLYDIGQEGNTLTILVSGEVEHYVLMDERPRVVGKVAPVSAFGELSLLLPGPRMLGARAASATVVYELSEGTLSMLSASDPRLALDLLKSLRTSSGAFLRPVRGLLSNLFVQAIKSAMKRR